MRAGKTGHYITVSVTVVLTEAVPEIAVTVIGYVPAGVPVAVFADAEDPETLEPPPHAIKPPAIVSNTSNKHTGENRNARLLMA